MGTPESIKKSIEIILSETGKIAVVVSAFSGVTDQLIALARKAAGGDKSYLREFEELKQRHFEAIKALSLSPEATLKEVEGELRDLEDTLHGVFLVKEVSPRTVDFVMSFGERLSAFIISRSIEGAEFLDARNVVLTDNNFGSARVNFEKTNENIVKYFAEHDKLQIITGFIGATENKETTTLGRGGSDYSAAIFGAALGAEEVQIWTDVDGIMTADPRKVKKAFSINQVSYEEAMEMSHFGAKVIHPPTMQPTRERKIPIRIKNTFNPAFSGSLIADRTKFNGYPIKGISTISGIDLLTLQGSGLIGVAGSSKRLFTALAQAGVNIILISQASSEHAICFAVNNNDSQKAKESIDEEFKFEIREKQVEPVSVLPDLSIIAAVGESMKKVPGTSGKIFKALGDNGVNVVAIAQGSSELNISIVINKNDESKAINAIHDSVFLSQNKTLNLFLIGPGLVGSTLLSQIEKQYEDLLNEQNLELKLVGLGDSKKMLFNEDGIPLQNWRKELEKGHPANLDEYLSKMKEMNLSNSIFVDTTSSQNVADLYPEILKSNISIVSASKKANSGSLESYLKLNLAQANTNARFLYETNVGAGLPVIGTLNDLIYSGDKIIKIEAVLSGTLSYIFNSFDGSKPFNEVVLEAKEKGYTEPDPRDDLNGLDVARKLLILARENGELLSMEDVKVESLVPEECSRAKSVEEFFQKLKDSAQYFEDKRQSAAKEGKKLCYIASLEGAKAQVRLEAIAQSHPFYNLSGSDNVISFKTQRYSHTPLVIKGPGAGAEVTAAGVFADILRISNTSFKSKMTRYGFFEKLQKKQLVISLVGMSNTGKTHWSKKLQNIGFKHICVDDIIEAKLEPVLREYGFKGIEDMAKWLDQPYSKDFDKRQQQYLDLEKETMLEIMEEISNSNENIVIDTTGSVAHTGGEILKKLRENTFVIYIESPLEMEDELFRNFIQHPKPIVWEDIYQQAPRESNSEALKKSYKNLLSYRTKSYKEQAAITIPYFKLATENADEQQFLELIKQQL